MIRLLRLAAFAIAIAGMIDPGFTIRGASRPRVALVETAPSAATQQVRDRLMHDLSPSYELIPQVTSDAAAVIAIGQRYPDDLGAFLDVESRARSGESALLVGTVSTPATAERDVHIVGVASPSEVPAATVIHLDVEVEAAAGAKRTTNVTVSIGAVEVGRASHEWTPAEKRWHAAIDAVPVGEPPYVLRVAIEGQEALQDVVVDLNRSPFRVEFYDPRPSWATTFVRRALEADARFEVASVTSSSRGVSTQTGAAVPLGDPHLDGFDVVLVGGLDRLSSADARALERFMRERGGTVVAVPDQRIGAGAALDLIAGGLVADGAGSGGRLKALEQLLEQPAMLVAASSHATVQASELLTLRDLTTGSDVIARLPGADGSPVIASSPRGEGRLVVSGAMDAWRFRAANNGAFDRFWQSTIAGLALAVAPPIAISVDPPLLHPGERAEVTARLRPRDVSGVSASIDGNQPVRLVPDPEAGVYRGQFVARATPGHSTLEVRAAGAHLPSASRTLVVQQDVARIHPTAAPSLALLSSSHRGIDVTPEHIADLEQFVRRAVGTPLVPLVRHPMRSTWWLIPFVFCLSAEWWLRRRQGLR